MSPAKGQRKRKYEVDEGVTRRVTRSMTRTPEAVSSSLSDPDPSAAAKPLKMSRESSPDRVTQSLESNIEAQTSEVMDGQNSAESPLLSSETWSTPWRDADQNTRWNDPVLWGGLHNESIVDQTWKRLTTAVAYLAGALSGCSEPYGSMDSSSRKTFEEFCPRAQYVVDSADKKSLCRLMMAYVWRFIWKHQLSPACPDKWQSEEWLAFDKIASSLRPHVDHINHVNSSLSRCYHNWRNSTAKLLYALHDPRPAASERIARLLHDDHVIAERMRIEMNAEERLMSKAAKHEPFWIDPRENLSLLIKDLADRVVEFEFCCSASKYRLEVFVDDVETGKPSGFPFRADGDMLDVRTWGMALEGQPVNFIVQPLFVAYGITYGDRALTSCTHSAETDVEDHDAWFQRSAALVHVGGQAVATITEVGPKEEEENGHLGLDPCDAEAQARLATDFALDPDGPKATVFRHLEPRRR